jgi:hypothetical protein
MVEEDGRADDTDERDEMEVDKRGAEKPSVVVGLIDVDAV